MCPNDSLTRQAAAQMVLVNGLYLDSRSLFCKTAALTFQVAPSHKICQ